MSKPKPLLAARLSPLEEGAIRGLLVSMLWLGLFSIGLDPFRAAAGCMGVVLSQMIVSHAKRQGWRLEHGAALIVCILGSQYVLDLDAPTQTASMLVLTSLGFLAFLQSGRELRWLVPFSLVPLAFSQGLSAQHGIALAVCWVLLAGLALVAVDRMPDREVGVLPPLPGNERAPEAAPTTPQQPLTGAQVPRAYYGLAVLGALGAILLGAFVSPQLEGLSSGDLQRLGLTNVDYWGFDDNPDLLNRGGRTDKIVMWVAADSPAQLRGRTFETWDGRFWGSEAPTFSDVTRDPNGAFYLPLSQRLDPGLNYWENTQRITFAKGGTDILFSPATPTRLGMGDGDTVTLASDGTLKADHRLDDDESYVVVSRVPRLDADRLRQSNPSDTNYNQAFRDAYLDVSGVTPRVQALAREITAGHTNAYDQAIAIEDWFDTNFEYLLDSPVPPRGSDAMEYLLFENRQGYCEQMGTAMVVMARSIGIPARLVSGFNVGEEFDQRRGEYVVRSKNAHAWAELYFPGTGWLAFDPTAGVQLSAEQLANQEKTGAFERLGQLRPILVVLAIMTAVGVLLAIGWRTIAAKRHREQQSWLNQVGEQLSALGAAVGRPPRPNETIREFVDALNTTELEHGHLPWIGALLSDAEFGTTEPDAEDRQVVDRAIADLTARLSRSQRAALQARVLTVQS